MAWANDSISPEMRRALAETETKIRKMREEGKLEEALSPSPEASKVKGSANPPGCLRLPIQGAVVVNYSLEDSPTAVPASYGLSRPKEDSFLAEIRLRFVAGPGVSSEKGPEALHAQWRSKVDGCLDRYAGKLRSSISGKDLRVRLTDNPSVPEQEIQIMPAGFHSNSTQYEEDISCAGLLHEALHLLGLPDEYRHQAGLKEPFHDCRAEGPADSIMSGHEEAVVATEPQMTYEVPFCRCEKKGTACWDMAMKSDGKKCPSGSSIEWVRVDASARSSLNSLNSNERFVLDLASMREAGFEKPARDTILYPAQFRAITEPGCLDVNRVYYDCSQNAYRHSKPAPGEGPGGPGQGCRAVPEACRWRSVRWLD